MLFKQSPDTQIKPGDQKKGLVQNAYFQPKSEAISPEAKYFSRPQTIQGKKLKSTYQVKLKSRGLKPDSKSSMGYYSQKRPTSSRA